MLPEYLCHYFEKAVGPLVSLSDLPAEKAEALQERLRREGKVFASRRQAEYLGIRRGLERQIRELFIGKGGQPQRERPHYFILGECAWVGSWYQDGAEVRIPLASVHPQAVSFTYGDSFPALRSQDGKPYRGQVYTLEELGQVIDRYGLPQAWNPNGSGGPERYIEAQLWADEPVRELLSGG